MALVEAIIAARPIIASDTGGIREIVTHGVSGLLFKTGDSKALAESILNLIEHPDRADRMVMEAARSIRKYTNRHTYINSFLNVYSELIRHAE